MGSDTVAKLDVMTAGRAVGIHVGTDLDSVIAVASFMGGEAVLQNPLLSEDQREQVKGLLAAAPGRSGYIAIQSTRPKTIGYALNDSPIGQLGWIGEKYAAWTDAKKDRIEDAVDLTQFLTTASLYWYGGGGAGSATALYEAFRSMDWARRAARPMAWPVFSADPLVRILFDPERKIAHWTEFDVGGHFPAMEVPDLLAAGPARLLPRPAATKAEGRACARPLCSVAMTPFLERQRLGPAHAGQRGDFAELLFVDGAVDREQRDGVAAHLGAAEVEVGDVDAEAAQQRAEPADMARLVLVGDIEHGRGELGLHVDALHLDDARLAVGEHRAGDCRAPASRSMTVSRI